MLQHRIEEHIPKNIEIKLYNPFKRKINNAQIRKQYLMNHSQLEKIKNSILYSKKQFFSTGFCAIIYYIFIDKHECIYIANFDFQLDKNRPIEYFNANKNITPYKGHNFHQEKAFVDRLIESGKVVVLEEYISRKRNFDEQHCSTNFEKKMIITRYNHLDITWIENFSQRYSFEIIIIDKKYKYPNVGRESGTILKYIIDNYYNLPTVMFFCQEGLNRLNEHCEKNHPWLPLDYYAKCTENEIIGHLRKILNEKNDWIGGGDVGKFKTISSFMKHFGLSQKFDYYLRCNNFAIGRNVILMQPQEFYKNLYTNSELSEKVNPNTAYFFEALNINVFTQNISVGETELIKDKTNVKQRTVIGRGKEEMNEFVGIKLKFNFIKQKFPFEHVIVDNFFPMTVLYETQKIFENRHDFKHLDKKKFPKRYIKKIENKRLLHYLDTIKHALVATHKNSLKKRKLPTNAEVYCWNECMYCIDDIDYKIYKHSDIMKKCLTCVIYINGKGSSTSLHDSYDSNITVETPNTPNTALTFVPMPNETIHSVASTEHERNTIQCWLEFDPSLNELNKFKESSTIIIGNSPNIFNYQYGSKIDKYEYVIRFNEFKIAGFEHYIGTKTTHWVVNCGSIKSVLKSKKYIISKKISIILILHYENETQYKSLVNKYHKNIKQARKELGKIFTIIPKKFLMCEKQYNNSKIFHCTTGLRLLMLLNTFINPLNTKIYGFDCLKDTRNLHYFEKCERTDMNDEKYKKHSSDLEENILKNIISNSSIKVLESN